MSGLVLIIRRKVNSESGESLKIELSGIRIFFKQFLHVFLESLNSKINSTFVN